MNWEFVIVAMLLAVSWQGWIGDTEEVLQIFSMALLGLPFFLLAGAVL